MTQTATDTQEARTENLRRFMDERSLEPNADYSYEDLIEIVDNGAHCDRYGAITYDETYTFINLFPTVEEACKHIANSLGDWTGGMAEGVLDLETGVKYQINVKIDVTLGDPAA